MSSAKKKAATRKFSAKKAKRERLPMLVGLVGPSGSGKTYSALRLATGMQKAVGGKIFVIDTEARRSLHYADDFDFEHVELEAPFGSSDYVEVIQYCVAQGATIVIVDSMSHEHEGPGGHLEFHDAELDRLAGDNYEKRNKMTFTAWIKPKAERRKLIDTVLRLGVNGIFCFRAKEKIKIVTRRDPLSLGWQPIAGDEFIYEMLVACLLYPGANGVPNWAPDMASERAILKKPAHLAEVFKDGEPLSEAVGEALAAWAAGDSKPTKPKAKGKEKAKEKPAKSVKPPKELAGVLRSLRAARSTASLERIRDEWSTHPWGIPDRKKLSEVYSTRLRALSKDETTEEPENEKNVCGSGPPGSECMQEPGHDGMCDLEAEEARVLADEGVTCGKGPTNHECRQYADHDGDCDWKLNRTAQESEGQGSFL